MQTSQHVFDQYEGHDVTAFQLTNDNGVSATILSQGGLIHEFNAPTANGGHQNVLLSYPTTADYYANPFYVNMAIGTAAGRTKAAKFVIDGKQVDVTANEGRNTLHGGPHGFSSVNWDGQTAVTDAGATLTLNHHFEGGAGEFPAMDVTITYVLDANNTLSLTYTATSEAPTVFNPTQHVYFNLTGVDSIRQQVLQLNTTRHLDVDAEKLPTGDYLDNAGTPFDFSKPTVLGDAIDGMQNTTEKGFDDIFEVKPDADNTIARLSDPDSQLAVTIHSSRNGLVVFTANSFTDDMNLTIGHGKPNMGVALEAQNLSDATRLPQFGDITLKPGEEKSYTIGYHLSF